MSKCINRRDLLKASAVAAGAAAVTAVPALADEAGWDEEYDIVVIGSGYAGMCAAIEAADAGSSVIVLEKNSFGGGNSILCGGNAQLGGGTSVQQAAGIEDTADAFYQELYDYGKHRANPALLHSFTDNCVEHVEWMKYVGVEFSETLSKQELSVARTHIPSEGMGNTYWMVFNKALEDRGVELRVDSKVTGLEFNEEGVCCGVDVGDTCIKAAQAVIIAAGGWKSNEAMCQHYDPRLDEDFTATGEPYVSTDGDIHPMVLKAGGNFVDMTYVGESMRIFGCRYFQWWSGNPEDVPSYVTGLTTLDFAGIAMVDGEGNRFSNEASLGSSTSTLGSDVEEFNDVYLSMTTRPRNVWAIADADGAALAGWDPEAIMSPSFDEPLEGKVRLNEDMVAYADSIEELAGKIGIDPAVLTATIDKYNGYAEAGLDEDFGKEAPLPIVNGPFYAAQMAFLTHDQMGGIGVNTRQQVLTADSQMGPEYVPLDECAVIPHLYAAGEATGGFFGVWRGHGKIGCYMIQGRHAAQAAVLEDRI